MFLVGGGAGGENIEQNLISSYNEDGGGGRYWTKFKIMFCVGVGGDVRQNLRLCFELVVGVGEYWKKLKIRFPIFPPRPPQIKILFCPIFLSTKLSFVQYPQTPSPPLGRNLILCLSNISPTKLVC